MHIRSAALTDVGRVREKNEDSHLVNDEVGLYVVADGMGGHLGGQMASSLAVKSVGEAVGKERAALSDGAGVEPLESSPVPRLLADAVRGACVAIYEAAQGDPELQGMGTTVTALLTQAGRAFVAHVGDSRCYLQRADRIIQITDDHSLVN